MTNDARQYRLRTLIFAVVVAAVWFAAFRVPGLGELVAGVVALVAIVAAGFVGLMALGWIGFGLFALVDRLVAWTRRAATWPDGPEDWGR
jgi:hypothetical protein